MFIWNWIITKNTKNETVFKFLFVECLLPNNEIDNKTVDSSTITVCIFIGNTTYWEAFGLPLVDGIFGDKDILASPLKSNMLGLSQVYKELKL